MTPEGIVKKELRAYLDSLKGDCWYYMPVPMGYGRRGVQDFLVCYKGFFLAPETKRRSGGISGPLQDENQEAVRRAGGASGRIINVSTVRLWVEECDRKHAILQTA